RHLSNDQNVRSLKKLHARSRARRGSRTHRSIRNAAAVPDGSCASAVPTATASARIIEKNAFMVLIVSLLTDRVRLFFDRTANRRFKSHKRGQLFIPAHNEAFSVVAVRVSNQHRSPVGIHCCDAAPTPTGF